MTFPYDEWFPDAPRDATYGYDEAALRAVEPIEAPDGFSELWSGWYAEARGTRADAVLTPVGVVEGREVFVIEHAASGGLRLRGWFARPVGGVEPRLGMVVGHGYGGRDVVEFERVPDDAAAIFPVARGLGALNPGLGAPLPEDGHVVFGIRSVEEYALGRCAVDLWHAANALVEVAGDLPLYYAGGSFGGGIGALALPWEERFVGATLEVPSFGQYDLRLRMPCEGSGERVRVYVEEHPEAREVLRFFDASSAALLTRIPVRAECALWDGVVPPPGQFGVAAGYADVELDVLPAGHAEYPGDAAVLERCRAATRAHVERVLAASR